MLTRALIVLLLVLNLGVAVWWALRPDAVALSPSQQMDGVPMLQLLSDAGTRQPQAAAPSTSRETMPADTPASTATQAQGADAPATEAPLQDATAAQGTDAPATETPPQAAAAAPVQCMAFGPFPDRQAADAAQAGLQSLATQVSVRTETRRRSSNWTVLVPPLADSTAARAMAQRIDAAGFKDYYVIGEGEAINGIALGRFGSEESARKHQAALQAAGFTVQVQAPAAEERYWLDAQLATGADAAAARRGAGAVQARSVACPPPR